MSLIPSVLTWPLTAKVAALAIALAVGVVSVSAYHIHSLTTRLDTANRTIGQLQGSIKAQNAQVDAWKASADATAARATAARKAAQDRHAGDLAAIAAIRGRRPTADPVQACKDADDLIHQFFLPQPKGAT